MVYFRFTAAVLLIAILFKRGDTASSTHDNRKIEFVNQSGKRLAVDWVNPKTGAMVPITTGIENGAKVVFDSFVNHTFAVHEISQNETCISEDGQSCENTIQLVKVTDEDDQVAVFKYKFGLEVLHKTKGEEKPQNDATSITEYCRNLAHEYIEEGYDPNAVMEDLAACLEDALTELLQKHSEELAFENEIRSGIANTLENHTCAEEDKQTSEPVEVRTWTNNDVTRDVYVMHNRPASQIHVLKNFISPSECEAIQNAAEPKLHRGTVADGKGGSKLSEHRKAFQAALPWKYRKDDDPIKQVMRRVYDYTNDAVGYNITFDGQEELMSIQYFGIGKNSTEPPDQYRPHCDGDCDGMPHKTGGRVATMVMYCTVPDLGGATNFQHANVYARPELGAAAFFSYLDPKTMLKDTGFTTHSGCPVIEGTKRIAVHWMRVGVNTDNPWNSFNTLTIRKGSEEEEDC